MHGIKAGCFWAARAGGLHSRDLTLGCCCSSEGQSMPAAGQQVAGTGCPEILLEAPAAPLCFCRRPRQPALLLALWHALTGHPVHAGALVALLHLHALGGGRQIHGYYCKTSSPCHIAKRGRHDWGVGATRLWFWGQTHQYCIAAARLVTTN